MNSPSVSLLRRLNTFDLTLITIGGVIGSGIFRTPAIVASRAHLPGLMLLCWILGGVIALIGAFVFAELAERHPQNGGLYAYLRDAYSPLPAFLFGWTALLVANTGAEAAAAVLFAQYLEPLTGLQLPVGIVAVGALAFLTTINCLGIRQAGTWQNAIVVLKVSAIAGLVLAGLFAHPAAAVAAPVHPFSNPTTMLGALGVAMLPVLFAYNGFQASTYVAGETIEPHRTIPRGIIFGVCAVIALYLLVNLGSLRVLGAAALAATKTPASDVMQAAVGPIGACLIAIAITLSTFGFVSTRLLLGPRVYFQMAADGTFFRQLAWIHPRTRVPTIAIALEGLIAAIIAASGSYEQILNWIVAPEWAFTVLAAGALFIFRKREADAILPAVRVPGHPFTTAFFIAVLLAIFVSELFIYPRDTLYGVAVMVVGLVVYSAWKRRSS
jgi:basic amino acid/polyamine antiporter, APA family